MNRFRPPRAGLAETARAALVLLVLAACLAAAHADLRRIAQAMTLAAPPLLWLAWPPRSARAARVRCALLTTWVAAFAVDAAIRGYLAATYDAAPNASMVVLAVANTVPAEAGEYFALAWPAIVPWALFAMAAIAVVGWATMPRGPR